MLLPDTSRRLLEPELMDDPALDAVRHGEALRGLERINRLSASVRILWRPIAELARVCGAGPLSLLDLATGAGDVPIGLWKRAESRGIRLQVDACDRSTRAVEHARRRAEEAGARIHFFDGDAVRDPIVHGYDVIMCSLFLHHLSRPKGLDLLKKMAGSARRMVLINDLERSPAGYLLARLGTCLITRSSVVHVDGPRSVRAAYTLFEARGLADDAGLDHADIQRHWPRRWLLKWNRT